MCSLFSATAASLLQSLLLCDPMDCSPPSSSVHGILQARTLEWVVMPSSRGSSQPRDQTRVFCIAGRFFTTEPSGKPISFLYEDVINLFFITSGGRGRSQFQKFLQKPQWIYLSPFHFTYPKDPYSSNSGVHLPHACLWALAWGCRGRGPLLRCSDLYLWQQPPSHPSVFLNLAPPSQKCLHIFSCLMRPPALPALPARCSCSVMTYILHGENSSRGPTHCSASSPTHLCSWELWLLLLAPLKKEVLPCSLWRPVSTYESSLLTQSPLSCISQCPLSIESFFFYICGLAGKEAACNAGDLASIAGLGRSPGEGKGYPLQYSWVSLVAQLVKSPSARQETWVRSLGWEDPLEKGKATHSSILAWRSPWTV